MLPQADDPNVLVGFDTSDDAAVYRQPDGSLLIATLDFFTPIVNNAYDFGAIAGANALSDMYAMNGTPLFALNIIGFPKNELPIEVLEDIMRGGSDAVRQAGIFVLGGHSIDDTEPKYGMVIVGRVESENQLIRNDTVQEGDALILTKPLGTGIINTAIKHRTIDESDFQPVIQTMKTLNKDAAEMAAKHSAHAMTDVTGYGLLGHLSEMLRSSGCTARLGFENIPVFDEVPELIAQDEVPGGTRRNLLAVRDDVDFGDLNEEQQLLVADAQTSGGLLISLPMILAEDYVKSMRELGHAHTAIIGRVIAREDSLIEFDRSLNE